MTYRKLNDTEVLQEGDEYLYHGLWVKTTQAGQTVAVNGQHVFDYRRQEPDDARTTRED